MPHNLNLNLMCEILIIEFALALLFIDNVLTDYHGRFLIKDLGYGTYYITCIYSGYKKLNTQPFTISLRHRAVNLGVITLENE